jgi:release factor glutamine methyltransferase
MTLSGLTHGATAARRPQGSIGSTLDQATATLRATHETARLDAEVLLAHVLCRPRHWLTAFSETLLGPEQAERFSTLVERRAAGEPVAHLTGYREFWSSEFEVTRDTLIPRPDTECLVEVALAHVPDGTRARLLDLGTGCGNLALSLARERPECQVTATDVCARALVVARRNLERLGIGNVEFCEGGFFQAVGDARFDLIVSNPPYVPDDDPHLGVGDVRFEPRIALEGGADGLTALRHIIANAPQHLKRNAWLCLEHGFDQATDVRTLLEQHGYRGVCTHRDAEQRERVTEGLWAKQASG